MVTERRRRRHSDNHNVNDDIDDIEHGIRRTQWNTSWVYRDSSSLTPAQIMEQELYYHAAEDSLFFSLWILQNLALLSLNHVALRNIVSHVSSQAYESGGSFCVVKLIINKLEDIMKHLLSICILVQSYGELALLYAEDLSIFIRRRHQFPPPRYRHLIEIDRSLCYSWFGQNPHNIMRLFIHWRVPNYFYSPSGHVLGGEECFIIFLHHMMKGNPFTHMSQHIFGGDLRSLSKMFDAIIDHIYNFFYNKRPGTSLNQWIPSQLHVCRKLIYDALSDGAIEEVCYSDGVVVDRSWILHHFNFDSFRPFGFLDDFGIPTARPGDSPTRSQQYAQDIQRAFYSGYL